jgi:hypothetical protein
MPPGTHEFVTIEVTEIVVPPGTIIVLWNWPEVNISNGSATMITAIPRSLKNVSPLFITTQESRCAIRSSFVSTTKANGSAPRARGWLVAQNQLSDFGL